MSTPELIKPDTSQEEELFEWAVVNGNWTKITSKNSNGRKCSHCGCNCPCRCECCRKGCCSTIPVGKK